MLKDVTKLKSLFLFKNEFLQKIQQFEKDIIELKHQIKDLNDSKTSIESEKASLEKNLSENHNRIEELERLNKELIDEKNSLKITLVDLESSSNRLNNSIVIQVLYFKFR